MTISSSRTVLLFGRATTYTQTTLVTKYFTCVFQSFSLTTISTD